MQEFPSTEHTGLEGSATEHVESMHAHVPVIWQVLGLGHEVAVQTHEVPATEHFGLEESSDVQVESRQAQDPVI